MNRKTPLQARTPLTRSTPLTSATALQPGSGLQRRTPLQAAGPIAARTAAKVKVPAPRAAPGHMRAAVSMVLAQERSIADAAREFQVDPDRLWEAAWTAAKKVVHDRDSEACGACGAPGVDVHHRYRRGAGGTSDTATSLGFANLVLLCREDHANSHDKDPELHARGFWLTRDQDPAEVPVLVATEYGHQRTWLLPSGEATLDDPREAAA